MPAAETSSDWRPLSSRESEGGAEAYDALHTGVPLWLRDSLWKWIEPLVSWNSTTGRRFIDADVLRQLERVLRFATGWDGRDPYSAVTLLEDKAKSDPTLMLDLADYLVGHPSQDHPEVSPQELDKLLEEAGSAYKVDTVTQPPALVRRVDATIEAAAKLIMVQETAPSTLLRLAWNATYGLHPNPSDGYRQAVRAVEAASIPVVLPNDRNATLGRAIGTLRNNPDQWQLSFTHRTESGAPIAALISMMALLWEGQYDRHVSAGVPLQVSQEEAETAVHLAVTLVQWFTTGRVSRRR